MKYTIKALCLLLALLLLTALAACKVPEEPPIGGDLPSPDEVGGRSALAG